MPCPFARMHAGSSMSSVGAAGGRRAMQCPFMATHAAPRSAPAARGAVSLGGPAGKTAQCPVSGRRGVVAAAVREPATMLPTSHTEASAKNLEELSKNNQANRYAQETKSSIISIGLTVATAPVELREKLAVKQEDWATAIADLCSYPHIEEAGVLSTCNRMEVYVVGMSYHRGVREVEEWMSKHSGIPLDELRPYLFLLRDRDAVNHLLHVSAGLDSLVMGEGQILAQVKSVFQVGQDAAGFGRTLNGLFKQAIQAGKRVRAETGIAKGAVSVSSAAAELAQMKLPTNSFDDAKVCIIGAGTMSRLLVKHLVSKGCTDMTIVNRSYPRVEELQKDFPDANITAKLSPDLMECVAESDVIFAASSSEDILITKEDVAAMGPASDKVGRERRFFDISVPRNIDQAISELEFGHCFNVDDLKEVVDANKEARMDAAREAVGVLDEERQAFEAWYESLASVPVIKRLRAKAENIRTAELEKAMSKLGDGLTKKQRKTLEEMSRAIVNKLTHGPMQALRADGDDVESIQKMLDSMRVIESVYDLQPDITELAKEKAAQKQSRASS